MPYGIPYAFLEALLGGNNPREGELVSPLDPYFGLKVKDWATSQVYPEFYDKRKEEFKKSEPPPERMSAQEKIAALQSQPPLESDEEQRAQLQRETNMRSLDALIGNPESGVPFPADKLLAIRAQAKAKGRAGSLGAADKLAKLQAVKGEEKKLANQQALIDKISQGTGKVPFDIANQLEMSGFSVPWPMRGMSKDQAKAQILDIQQKARADIERLGFGGAPESVVRYLQYVDSVMPQLVARIEAGEDPDSVISQAMDLIATNADKSGTMDYIKQMGSPQEAK